MLSQLGYESCWRTREELWPVIEDRNELLDFQQLSDIQDARSESCYSVASSFRDSDISRLHSPGALSSSLFFIEEEGKNGCDIKQTCDKNSNFDSSAYIPHRVNNRFKTLPHDSRRSNILPIRPQTIRSVAVHSDRLRSASDDTDKRFVTENQISEKSQDDSVVHFKSNQMGEIITMTNENTEISKDFESQDKVKSEDKLIGILKGTKLEQGMRGRSATLGSERPTSDNKQNKKNNSSQSAENIHRKSGSFNIDVSVIPLIKLPSIDLDNQEVINDSRSPPTTIHISVEPSKSDTQNKKCNFRIGSDDEDEDHKVPEERKKEVHLPPHLRESRGNSSDSSSKTSKSRTDSFNTDSTTSGIGSMESGPHIGGTGSLESAPHGGGASEMASLSPIASTSSLEAMMRQNSQEKSTIHPSIKRRKSLNLNRIPSLRKSQASPAYGILPSSRMSENLSSENAIMYTSSQDALGYSTWRSLRRQRTYSSDIESELNIGVLYQEETSTNSLSRQSSIESKISFDLFALRNMK